MRPPVPIEIVGSPSHLPKPPRGRVAVLDVAFASGEKFDLVTESFVATLGDRLALWCDHHEHPFGWAKYRSDPRFLLVPNRVAHACPELVTPEVARRAGKIDALVVHGDFDGLLTAAKLLRGGEAPYPEADEDARAVDSPGRGHLLSPPGRRLALAVDEAVATFTAGARRDFLVEAIGCLATDGGLAALGARVDELAARSEAAQAQALSLARAHGSGDVPGLFVVRLAGRRKGRERKAILRHAEEQAKVGVLLETDGKSTWLTAATFDEEVDLSTVAELQGGRSDYRYCEPRGPVDQILLAISRAVRR